MKQNRKAYSQAYSFYRSSVNLKARAENIACGAYKFETKEEETRAYDSALVKSKALEFAAEELCHTFKVNFDDVKAEVNKHIGMGI